MVNVLDEKHSNKEHIDKDEQRQQRPSLPTFVDPNLATRQLYAADLATEQLTDDQTWFMTQHFGGGTTASVGKIVNKEKCLVWESFMQKTAEQVNRHLGMIDHHKTGYDTYVSGPLCRGLRKMKPHIVYKGNRVHIWKIVDATTGPPSTLLDHDHKQYGPMTRHLCSLTNSSYSLQVFVQLAYIVFEDPKFLMGHPEYVVPNATLLESNLDLPVASVKMPNGGTKRKRTTTNSASSSKSKLDDGPPPDGWHLWPIRSEKYTWMNVPHSPFPLLTGSYSDPRVNGNEPKSAFTFNSPTDVGGQYQQKESTVHMAVSETMLHNKTFVLPWNKASEASGRLNWKYPNLHDSYAQRNREAMQNFDHHMHEMHRIEVRSSHPTRINRSTSTFVTRVAKFNRYDLINGQLPLAQYQYLTERYPLTVLFRVLGVALHKIVPLIQDVAGEHWYPAAYRHALDRMIERHPLSIRTEKDAALFLYKLAQTPAVTGQKPSATEKKEKSEAYKLHFVAEFVKNDLFPHVGVSSPFRREKAVFLARFVHAQLMKTYGNAPYDSKDHYPNQRYDTNAIMHASFQRRSIPKDYARRDLALRTHLRDHPDGAPDALNLGVVFGREWADAYEAAMITGDWSPEKKSASSRKQGTMRFVSYNDFGEYSHARQCRASSKASRKAIESRLIDNGSYARRDPSDTPEGQMCGIVHTFSCGTTLAYGSSLRTLMLIMKALTPKKEQLLPVRDLFLSNKDNDDSDEDDSKDENGSTTTKKRKRQPQAPSSITVTKKATTTFTTATLTTTTSGNVEIPSVYIPVAPVVEGTKTRNGKRKRTAVVEESMLEMDRQQKQNRWRKNRVGLGVGLSRNGLYDDEEPPKNTGSLVALDGGTLWKTPCAEAYLRRLRHLRQTAQIDPFVSCEWREHSIESRAMPGRNVRAVFRLKGIYDVLIHHPKTTHPLFLKETWSYWDMMNHGIIEYFDGLEEPSKRIATGIEDFVRRSAMGERFSHMEIDASWMLGVVSGLFPFADRNQGPRAVLAASMLKQAFANNMNPLKHTLAKQTLFNAQHSPTETRVQRHFRLRRISPGPVVKLNIYNHRANQEDAWVANKGAKQLGCWWSTKNRTYVKGVRRPNNGAAMPKADMVHPLHGVTLLANNYDKVGQQTLPQAGEYMEKGDVVIRKPANQYQDESIQTDRVDDSLVVGQEYEGTVESTFSGMSDDLSVRISKANIRTVCDNHHGDKFCVDEDTEILTERDGWKPVAQITTNDRVATLVDGHQLGYANPTECLRELYTGQMYNVRSKQLDIRVTAEHRMWVQIPDTVESEASIRAQSTESDDTPESLVYEWCRAKDLLGRQGVRYQANATWSVEKDYQFYLPSTSTTTTKPLSSSSSSSSVQASGSESDITEGVKVDMKTWLFVMGVWLMARTHPTRMVDGIAMIKRYCRTAELPYEDVLAYMATVEPTKFPEWVWELSPGQCQLLLHGFAYWSELEQSALDHKKNGGQPKSDDKEDAEEENDDTETNKEKAKEKKHVRHLFVGAHELIADSLQQLLLHAGWVGYKEKSSRGWHIFIERGNTVVEAHDWMEDVVNEPVYCLSVPSQVFYMRRNGKCVWTGNSTRHGQKGTLGELEDSENLPFSCADGTVADIYGNIIAVPSRLTDGHMSEHQITTYCINVCEMMDATLFETMTQRERLEYIRRKISEYGGHVSQMEGHIYGRTGEQMEGPLCVGYIQMMKLRHMTVDKEHSRGFGPKQILTRQPTDGRARDGGHRFGYMERDNIDAHGAAAVGHERMARESDYFPVPFCTNCKNIADYHFDTHSKYCRVCLTGKYVQMSVLTYVTKLLIQEFAAMGIRWKPEFIDMDHPVSYIPRVGDKKSSAFEDHVDTYKKVSLMPKLEPSEYTDYGLNPPPNYREFLKTLPSIYGPKKDPSDIRPHAFSAEIQASLTKKYAAAIKHPMVTRSSLNGGGGGVQTSKRKRETGVSASKKKRA